MIAIELAYAKPVVISFLGKKLGLLTIGVRSDLYTLTGEICRTIAANGKRGEIVMCETPVFTNNINSAYMLSRAHGMLEKGLRDTGFVFFGIHPRTWQTDMLKGYPGKSKEASMACASEFMNAPVTNDDIADAINMARYGRKYEKVMRRSLKKGTKFTDELKQEKNAKSN